MVFDGIRLKAAQLQSIVAGARQGAALAAQGGEGQKALTALDGLYLLPGRLKKIDEAMDQITTYGVASTELRDNTERFIHQMIGLGQALEDYKAFRNVQLTPTVENAKADIARTMWDPKDGLMAHIYLLTALPHQPPASEGGPEGPVIKPLVAVPDAIKLNYFVPGDSAEHRREEGVFSTFKYRLANFGKVDVELPIATRLAATWMGELSDKLNAIDAFIDFDGVPEEAQIDGGKVPYLQIDESTGKLKDPSLRYSAQEILNMVGGPGGLVQPMHDRDCVLAYLLAIEEINMHGNRTAMPLEFVKFGLDKKYAGKNSELARVQNAMEVINSYINPGLFPDEHAAAIGNAAAYRKVMREYTIKPQIGLITQAFLAGRNAVPK
ncbi:MAG: hypothetical protein ABIJ34_05735 [archaeon]